MVSPTHQAADDNTPLRVHVAGWRGVAHSIALVNQWQILSMLKMPGISLTCEDLVYASPSWKAQRGIFSDEETDKINGVPPLAPDGVADVDLHVPLRLGDYRSSGRPTVAFLPAELRGRAVLDNYEPVEAMNARRNMLFMVASNWVRDSFVEQGLDARRVVVLGHGVDTNAYHPAPELRTLARSQLRLGRFTFLHVSGMFGVKGLNTLLEAFITVLRRGIPARLLLKGTDGVYSSRAHLIDAIKLFPQADRDLLTANMTYVGHQMSMKDMTALYNAADCFVTSYHAEGFGMPVLEAVACGLPVICTGGGSTDDFTTDDFRKKIFADLAVDDVSAILMPRAADLANKMATMVFDAPFRRQAAVAGPAYVAANATWDKVTERLVRILRGWRDGVVVQP